MQSFKQKTESMKAFDDEIIAFLRDDNAIIQSGYANKSTSSSVINAYTLIIDGEASCKLHPAFLDRFLDACKNTGVFKTRKKHYL